ncbi:MAG: hypothetical protein WCG80_17755 [Spirochaetales bacterium]
MELLIPGVTLEWAVKMVFGFSACVAGIMLWAHNRQPAWVFIILATLLAYVKVLLDFVDSLGLYALDSWQPGGVPVLRLAFAGGVPLLYAIGLFLAYRAHYR